MFIVLLLCFLVIVRSHVIYKSLLLIEFRQVFLLSNGPRMFTPGRFAGVRAPCLRRHFVCVENNTTYHVT